jgi:hypothetical protein
VTIKLIILFLQFIPVSGDYFGNRLKEYELSLRLQLNLTHGYYKTVWPYSSAPTEANAGYSVNLNAIGKHNCVTGLIFVLQNYFTNVV